MKNKCINSFMELKLIRGKRILQQLIQEASYGTLDKNTRTKMPPTDRREHISNKQNVQNITLIPALPSKVLKIEAKIKGETNSYDIVIQFDNVVFEKIETTKNIEIKGIDNKPYFIKPIALAVNNAKVFCSCLDFKWRFSLWNLRNNSLYGQAPQNYVKKSDRPPVNPLKVPGVCKHLIKTVETLQESGLII